MNDAQEQKLIFSENSSIRKEHINNYARDIKKEQQYVDRYAKYILLTLYAMLITISALANNEDLWLTYGVLIVLAVVFKVIVDVAANCELNSRLEKVKNKYDKLL